MADHDTELDGCRALLGVAPDASSDALRQAYARKSFALIRDGAPAEAREQLRAAHALLEAALHAAARDQAAALHASAKEVQAEAQLAALLAEAEQAEYHEPQLSPADPRSFD